jgi:ribonuclease HII
MTCRLTGLIGGLDEAGRAPLAGPVVSSCVMWQNLPSIREKVKDSKLLSEKEREYFFEWITEHAYKVTVGIATHEEIENLNIHYASLLSMKRAVIDTNLEADLLLVDGLFPIKGIRKSKPIVKGDRKCFFVACASIIAKVTRDRLMTAYGLQYPQYGWKKNKGYPTAEHRKAIQVFGISPIHRKTFKGVREYVCP